MNQERDEKLAQLKEDNPEWGRGRLSRATGYPPAYVQRWLDRVQLAASRDYGTEDKQIAEILESLSDRERAHLLKMSGRPSIKSASIELASDSFKFGFMSDTHIGHEKFDVEAFMSACEFWAREEVDHIYHAGDIVEGMSGRDGHLYELDLLGFESQVDYAAKLLSECPAPVFGITGNHDQWYKIKGNCGACVGMALNDRVDNFTFLGEDEAIHRVNGIDIMLRHPRDGSAYAYSYKGQKFIESISGGRKPNIVINGHYHKALHYQTRNVEYFEAGTLQGQSQFMRGKGSAAHKCVGVAEVFTDGVGIQQIKTHWLRFYE